MAISNREELRLALKNYFEIDDAALMQSKEETPFETISITLDLTTAKTREQAYKIGFPYKSVYVAASTDVNTTVNFIPDTNDTFQSSIPLNNKDVLQFDKPKAQGFIYWNAQNAKTITLIFFVKGTFKSGSYLTQSVGSGAGTVITSNATLAMTSANTIIIAQDSSRAKLTLFNEGPATVFIGDSACTALTGIPVLANSYYETTNQAGWYGLTSAGTATLRVLKES